MHYRNYYTYTGRPNISSPLFDYNADYSRGHKKYDLTTTHPFCSVLYYTHSIIIVVDRRRRKKLFNLPALQRAYCTAQSTCSGIFDHSTPPHNHTAKVRINSDFFFLQCRKYLFKKKEKKNNKFDKNERIQKHIIYSQKSMIYARELILIGKNGIHTIAAIAYELQSTE